MKRKLLLMFVLGLLIVGCKGGQTEPVEAVSSHQKIIDAARMIEKMRLEYRGGKDKEILDNASKDGVIAEYARADAEWLQFYGLCVHDSLEAAYSFLDRVDASKLLIGTFYMSLAHTDIMYDLLSRVVEPIVEEFCSDKGHSLALRLDYWKGLVDLMEMTMVLHDGYVPDVYENANWALANIYVQSGLAKDAVARIDGLRMVKSQVMEPKCAEFEACYDLAFLFQGYDTDVAREYYEKYLDACQNLLSDYGSIYTELGLMGDYREAVRDLMKSERSKVGL